MYLLCKYKLCNIFIHIARLYMINYHEFAMKNMYFGNYNYLKIF